MNMQEKLAKTGVYASIKEYLSHQPEAVQNFSAMAVFFATKLEVLDSSSIAHFLNTIKQTEFKSAGNTSKTVTQVVKHLPDPIPFFVLDENSHQILANLAKAAFGSLINSFVTSDDSDATIANNSPKLYLQTIAELFLIATGLSPDQFIKCAYNGNLITNQIITPFEEISGEGSFRQMLTKIWFVQAMRLKAKNGLDIKDILFEYDFNVKFMLFCHMHTRFKKEGNLDSPEFKQSTEAFLLAAKNKQLTTACRQEVISTHNA